MLINIINMKKINIHTCSGKKGQKCLSCQRKSITANSPDFTLCDNDLDLIVGGLNNVDVEIAKERAVTDMGLESFIPASYFE